MFSTCQKTYAVFVSVVRMALKRASCVSRSQYVFEVTSLCLYACMQPCLPLVNGFVDDALRKLI